LINQFRKAGITDTTIKNQCDIDVIVNNDAISDKENKIVKDLDMLEIDQL